MLVFEGNVIGSHTYCESLTGPPHAPETLDAVAYWAWLGLQPVAPEVSRK
ncbi:hypothetical protein [Streptomyces synnematoformans]|uniref:Uncharacterized protein n=1 Tax=Streptomyces synnematoformans TaxID=415721 RepID=A0ABN2YRU7_9ACTN